jgi:parallel beta-helix repeat protein
MTFIRIAAFAAISFASQQAAVPDEMFVDASLDGDCAAYVPESRTCADGTARAFTELPPAVGQLKPGDILYLREGTYGSLTVPVSGTPAEPIEIRGMQNESVMIKAPDVAIRVIDQSNIIIANLSVTQVQGFGRVENATGITIENVEFQQAAASGTTGSLKLVRSSLNRITGNSFADGSDLVLLQDDSNNNLLTENKFGRAAHSLISIRCSSENIVRNNVFDNPEQKAVEIYDCVGVSDAPVRLDGTRRNVIELNHFKGTATARQPHKFNAIQHGGQETIVRFNVFTGNQGGGVNYQYYSDESLFVHGNRLYNNTFVNNRCYGIAGQRGSSRTFYDNRVVNNLLYLNFDCRGFKDQVSLKDDRQVVYLHNVEVDADPGFVDVAGGDFRLRASSREIDSGVFVAHAKADGHGTELPVDDVRWFHDGFGIPGQAGDKIQIQGTQLTAEVIDVDYDSNKLILDRNLTWERGDGVHVAFAGEAPDSGAYEFTTESEYP